MILWMWLNQPSLSLSCSPSLSLIEPSPVSYKAALVIENPCDPNPCAEGYFCAINHKCQTREQGCTSFSCQPGCIIGDRPSFVVPEDSGVRVNLITDSSRSCYGYFNCSIVRQGMTGRPGGSDEIPAAIGGTALSGGFQPVHNHCESGSTCMVDGAMKGENMNKTPEYDAENFISISLCNKLTLVSTAGRLHVNTNSCMSH